jgi:hypothetical protein
LSKTLHVEQPAESTSLTDRLSDVTERISDATSSSATLAEKRRQQDMSNASVTKEIEALRTKLDTRKKLEQADPQVNKAKDDVERGRDLQEGGRPAGEGFCGEDDKMSAVRYPSNAVGTFLRAPDYR